MVTHKKSPPRFSSRSRAKTKVFKPKSALSRKRLGGLQSKTQSKKQPTPSKAQWNEKVHHHKIKKVLIANRGEIAMRIQRSCRELGIPTVLAISEADRDTLFARSAEEIAVLGPAAARESYLNAERIVAVARETGCDAIHPGYGFLSENAPFAQLVEEAGINFIGPTSETIRIMGSKTLARERVIAAGVPCAPGSPGGLSDAELIAYSKKIGLPLLIKAVGGGGGRGMRTVHSFSELAEAIALARKEALKHFGNGDVFLERYIEKPRHVEVQVFGDKHGNIIHLGTRDCSTQRRHQKIIEEAPAPDLSPRLRERIHQAAVAAARSVAYVGAGTVEMLVKGNEFFFLEMNTRIQVEHPVTEMVTGVDLVALQLRVAMGEPLPIRQPELKISGHAMEFRIYAEDPERGFMPGAGRLLIRERPVPQPGVREDFGYESGDQISVHYDAMIGKLIVHAADRAQVIAKSIDVLSSYVILGVPSNVDLERWLLENGLFRQSPVDIGFVEREFTRHCLRTFRASHVKDPRHRAPIGGAEVKDEYEYTSETYPGVKYRIEVIHQKDGFFMAVPLSLDGKRRAPTCNCRRSNGLQTAVKALINDVLNKQPPALVFAE